MVLTINVHFIFVRKKKIQFEDEEDVFGWCAKVTCSILLSRLSVMTENFSRKLGEGGFGYVFEGVLREGTKIATKRLKGLDQIRPEFIYG